MFQIFLTHSHHSYYYFFNNSFHPFFSFWPYISYRLRFFFLNICPETKIQIHWIHYILFQFLFLFFIVYFSSHKSIFFVVVFVVGCRFFILQNKFINLLNLQSFKIVIKNKRFFFRKKMEKNQVKK